MLTLDPVAMRAKADAAQKQSVLMPGVVSLSFVVILLGLALGLNLAWYFHISYYLVTEEYAAWSWQAAS